MKFKSQPIYTRAQSFSHSPPQSHTTIHRSTDLDRACRAAHTHHHSRTPLYTGAQIWSTEGRGGWEKEEKEGEAHGRRLGHDHLHTEWKGEKEEKEGEAHGRRARGRRLGQMDLQRRAHGFAEEEGTRFCTGGGHTTGGNGLTSFSYLLSVHANCLMKCLIECLMKCLIECLMKC
jgi:hypothetical protein